MELYIRIKNNEPFEHPILGDNFRQAYPLIDVNNLPIDFAKFIRVAPPILGPYEIYEGLSYEWNNNIVTDVHHVRLMTEQEKIIKQNSVKEEWELNGYESWIFDENSCSFQPPVKMPEDVNRYLWDESSLSWNTLAISTSE